MQYSTFLLGIFAVKQTSVYSMAWRILYIGGERAIEKWSCGYMVHTHSMYIGTELRLKRCQ